MSYLLIVGAHYDGPLIWLLGPVERSDRLLELLVDITAYRGVGGSEALFWLDSLADQLSPHLPSMPIDLFENTYEYEKISWINDDSIVNRARREARMAHMDAIKDELVKLSAAKNQPFAITINGREMIEFGPEVSYGTIARLASRDVAGPYRLYNIAYSKGVESKPSGIISPGESIPLAHGMSFSAFIPGDAQ